MTRKTHVMLDIETLDSSDNAVVVSIGAVRMNHNLDISEDKFYVILEDLDEQLAKGRSKNECTLKWWAELPEWASDPFLNPWKFPDDLRPTKRGLEELNQFLKNSYVWGYGCMFDNVIIRNIFKDYGIKPLWHYRDDMDFRTLANLFPIARDVRTGIHHNALDDAMTQMIWLREIVLQYGIKLSHLN